MAIYHLSCKIGSRANGQSAIASASYRSAEKLHAEYENKTYNYTRKQAVIYSNILLPENAPIIYKDREKLWNAVEQTEKQNNAQLYREFEVSLPNECTLDEKIALADEFAEHLKKMGMCVDYSIHDVQKNQYKTKHRKATNDNSHCHFMCTMRKIDKSGKFEAKRKRGYKLDKEGKKIPILDKNGNQKVEKKTGRKLYEREDINNTIIVDKDVLLEVRKKWQEIANKTLAKYNTRIDCRTLDEQVAEKVAELEQIEKELAEARKQTQQQQADSLNFVTEKKEPTCDYYKYYTSYKKMLDLQTRLAFINESQKYNAYELYQTNIDRYIDEQIIKAKNDTLAELKKYQKWHEENPEPPILKFWKNAEWHETDKKYQQAQQQYNKAKSDYDRAYQEHEDKLKETLIRAERAKESASVYRELTPVKQIVEQNKQFYHERMKADVKAGIKPKNPALDRVRQAQQQAYLPKSKRSNALGVGQYREDRDNSIDVMDSNTDREQKWLRSHGYER